MKELKGKGVSAGIAIGPIRFYRKEEVTVKREHIEDTDAELARLEKAKDQTLEQLSQLYEKARQEVGEASAQIFEVHQMMVEDDDYQESIHNFITAQKLNAEFAVATTADNFAEMFASMDDAYMKERAADVRDVSERLLRNLQNKSDSGIDANEKYILCADDLAPSETVQMDKTNVLAFCTKYGASNSHTAILARTMNLPAIIGLGEALTEDMEGKEAIIDGRTGVLILEPDEQTREQKQQEYEKEQKHRELLQELKGQDNVTPYGQSVNVYANIGGLNDIGAVLENDARGIGLFRSEFLYLENSDYPDEEQQFQCYKKVLELMAGKKVIIRTMDIGADKQIDYFKLDKEENPALGYRAIRICLTRPEIFRTQLRALYRASYFGSLGIMFPMIISVEEVREIKEIVESVKKELDEEGIPYSDDVELGIMIETPAAAMVSDQLAPEVDFFSVGTNDLTQYTLAIDRQNPHLDRFLDIHHPALLRLIQFAADNAHKAGAWIGICGELGGDLELTDTFLAMGIDELSVSPSRVLPLRERIRSVQKEEMEAKQNIYRIG